MVLHENWLNEVYKLTARKIFAAPTQPKSDCLHKSCTTCNGTGISIYGGSCIHGISCSCKDCRVS